MIRRSDGLPLVMGVVNVTPDSFSDGGQWFEPDAAIAHGRDLSAQGADILDVGGESTRPGAERPSLEEELRRVLPVVEALGRGGAVGLRRHHARRGGLPGRRGRRLAHQRRQRRHGRPRDGGSWPRPRPCPSSRCTGAATAATCSPRPCTTTWSPRCAPSCPRAPSSSRRRGSARRTLVLDPGFGFAKLGGPQLERCCAASTRSSASATPSSWAPRARRSSGGWAWPTGGAPRPPLERDVATAATSMYAARHGVWAVRVHDVRRRRRLRRRSRRWRRWDERRRVARDRDRPAGRARPRASTASSSTSSARARQFVVDVEHATSTSRRPGPATTSPTPSTTPRWPVTWWR